MNNIRVPNIALIYSTLIRNSDTIMVGSVSNTNAVTKTIQIWYDVYILPPLVHILLEQNLTAPDLWFYIYWYMVAAGIQECCCPV